MLFQYITLLQQTVRYAPYDLIAYCSSAEESVVHLQIHTGDNIHSGFSLVRFQLDSWPFPRSLRMWPSYLPAIPPFTDIPCIEELAEMVLSCLP